MTTAFRWLLFAKVLFSPKERSAEAQTEVSVNLHILSLTSTSQVDADEPFSIFVVNNCLRCEHIQTTDLLRRRVPVQCERTHQQSFSKPNQVLVTKPHVRKHAQRCYRVPSASAKQPVSVSAGPFMEQQYRVKLRLNHNFS